MCQLGCLWKSTSFVSPKKWQHLQEWWSRFMELPPDDQRLFPSFFDWSTHTNLCRLGHSVIMTLYGSKICKNFRFLNLWYDQYNGSGKFIVASHFVTLCSQSLSPRRMSVSPWNYISNFGIANFNQLDWNYRQNEVCPFSAAWKFFSVLENFMT